MINDINIRNNIYEKLQDTKIDHIKWCKSHAKASPLCEYK